MSNEILGRWAQVDSADTTSDKDSGLAAFFFILPMVNFFEGKTWLKLAESNSMKQNVGTVRSLSRVSSALTATSQEYVRALSSAFRITPPPDGNYLPSACHVSRSNMRYYMTLTSTCEDKHFYAVQVISTFMRGSWDSSQKPLQSTSRRHGHMKLIAGWLV